MFVGQPINFTIYDRLLDMDIEGTGVLVSNVYGKLWRIQPHKHTLLSGGIVLVHENKIEEKTNE